MVDLIHILCLKEQIQTSKHCIKNFVLLRNVHLCICVYVRVKPDMGDSSKRYYSKPKWLFIYALVQILLYNVIQYAALFCLFTIT